MFFSQKIIKNSKFNQKNVVSSNKINKNVVKNNNKIPDFQGFIGFNFGL